MCQYIMYTSKTKLLENLFVGDIRFIHIEINLIHPHLQISNTSSQLYSRKALITRKLSFVSEISEELI